MSRIKIILPFLFLMNCVQDAPVDTPVVANEWPVAKADRNVRPGLKPIGQGVMMQAFYWDVPGGGTWWQHVDSKVEDWSNAGIDAIWIPPASKAQNGPFSMGYDPFDYFDLGEFDQMGSTETRFGSRDELKSMIDNAHTHGLSVIGDIVLNHNSGGASEENIFSGESNWTDFNPKSEKFLRSQNDFHPNNIHSNDSGAFGGFPDLCHHQNYVQEWLWKRDDSVAKFYHDEIGFDGWRFDYVKGFEPWVVRDWKNSAGGFSVGELWDANVDILDQWTRDADASAFDFAAYYRMRDAFVGNNMRALGEDMLWKRNANRAVTFVTNHDTDEIRDNKLLAYAYILTHEGYPTIFYTDYEEWLDKDRLNNLIWIHNNIAGGSTDILFIDDNEYIARRNGNDSAGLVVYINNSDDWSEQWIDTNWSKTKIKDYTGNSNWHPTTANDRRVKIQAPPRSYSVWSVE